MNGFEPKNPVDPVRPVQVVWRIICALVLFLAPAALAQNRPVLTAQLGHAGMVNSVAFSPDGRLLASASLDSTIILWDVASGQALQKLTYHAISVNNVEFSRDGRILASCDLDGMIFLYDVVSGEVRSKQDSNVQRVRLSRDRRKLAALHGDGTIVSWDVGTFSKLGEIKHAHAKDMSVNDISFSPDGRIVATAGDDGNIVISEGLATPRSLKGNRGPIKCVTFSPNGQLLAWGGNDGVVSVWDGKSTQNFKEHTENVWAVSFSRDGRLLASASDGANGCVVVRDLQSGATRTYAEGQSRAVAFRSDGVTLAAGPGDTVVLWDIATGGPPRTFAGRANSVSCVAYSPDATQFAVVLYDKIVIWDAMTGEAKRTLNGGMTAAFSPDGRLLASSGGNYSGKLIVRDTVKWTERTFTGHTAHIYGIAFSPDGRFLASAGYDKTVILWDVASGEQLRTLKHASQVTCVAFSPDGALLASGSGDNSVTVWDRQSGAVRGVFREHTKTGATSVAFSPNGQILASGGDDNLIILRDLNTGARRILTGHTLPVNLNCIKFSPDGRTLVSGSRDKTLILWNVASGKPVGTSRLPVRSVAFSGDGHRLVIGCGDGTVRVWNAANGRAIATLMNINDGKDWLAATSEGYYHGTPEASQLIRWRIGGQLFPVEAFEQSFYRPDLVRKALQGESMIASRPEIERFEAGQAIPPQVTFVSPHDGQEVTGDQLDLQVTATDDRDVKGVVFFINGRPVAAKPIPTEAKPIPTEAKPIAIEAKQIPTSHKVSRQFQVTVPMPPGETTLTLKAIAYDDEGLQAWDTVRIMRKSAAPVVGDLYVLAIGVSRYRNPKYNLKYATADAQAFASLWKSTEGTLNRRVIVTGLTDAQATAGNIRTALSKLIDTATDKDSVALFLSGHGLLQQGEDGETYYFATHEIDPTNKATLDQTALPWTVLQETLARVRAKRMLMFLDACHSGSTLGGTQASNDRLARLLAKAGGVMVFASSRGSQYSYELDDLKHGAFTAALMEGILQGKADAGERDGNITPVELLAWLQERVPQLTGRQQMPACPFMSDFGEPFPLAKVR